MSRFDDRLTDAFDEIAGRTDPSDTALADFRARVARDAPHEEVVIMLTPDYTPNRRPKWLVPAVVGAAAAMVAALAGVIAVRSGADDAVAPSDTATVSVPDVPSETSPATTPPAAAADPVSSASDDVGVMNGWGADLQGVTAGPAPQAAACPDGSAVDFDAPIPVPPFLEPQVDAFETVATFDRVTNSVVVVRRGADTVDGATSRSTVAGRFDVCTGEWTAMNADFGNTAADGLPAWLNALVYDVDSDALVGFSHDAVHVYDRTADAWSIRPYDSTRWVISAAYHPSSGRILVVTGDALAAYDVDEAEWQWIFQPRYDPFVGEILGIDTELDRIVIAEGVGVSNSQPTVTDVTRLVDPATGEYTDVPTPGRPVADIYNGWGPREAFGQIAGTVFVSDHANGTICGFNGETLAWDLCVDSPLVEGTPTSSGWAGEWAIVGDPVNDRLIAIPPSGPIRSTPLP
jgi:hypothetical protein